MEAASRSQEEIEWEARAVTLRKEFEILRWNLGAVARGGPPVFVDLCLFLNQCLELDALHVQLGHDHGFEWCSAKCLNLTTYELIWFANTFQKLKYLLGGQLNSAWDITLASIGQRHLRTHVCFGKEDDRVRNREKHAIESHLEWIAFSLNQPCYGETDFALTLRDHKAMKSYGVLSLFGAQKEPLSAVKALADVDGAIYVRSEVGSVSSIGARSGRLLPSTYIRSQHEFSKHTLTRTSFLESAEEPEAVGMRDTEGRRRQDNLGNAPPELGASAYADVPIPGGIVSHNEASRVRGSFQDPSTNTHFEASYPQSGITDHYARMAMGPSGVFKAPEQTINMYGFAHIPPFAPMNAVNQGLLPYESRDRAAPASITSPEADSPWSERDGPPPPYALSPGTYHLRLETATRPSPPLG